ncbi:transmembrane protein, putative [Medicago truncatula]|uniref:Transmembrane protein, putative n=1 Tax=Medicago truncatula TaxID=3880 RepID=G7LDT7_MEDTR|nr:transmembrane protein, putative [Medicago truncatula]
MFKIARYILLCITLLVVMLFMIVIFKIDEIGSIFLELVILVVFPLLIIAWIITSCPDMDLGLLKKDQHPGRVAPSVAICTNNVGN